MNGLEREMWRSAFHRHHCMKGQVHDLAFCISRACAPTLATMPEHAPPTLADTLPARLRPLRTSDAADDQLIGTVGLNGVDLWHGRGELAYDLDPRWQGQGLATHAARAVLDWAHGTCGLVRIQATVLDSNARSIALLERLGMQREGRLRAYRHVRGQPRDFWMYAHINGVVSPR